MRDRRLHSQIVASDEPAWRPWVRSWWVVLAALAWINWSAFVYVGLRARRRRWLIWATAYLAVSATSLVLIALDPGIGEAETLGQIGAWLGILSWAFSFAHALGIRRDFLERIEAVEDPRLDEAEDRLRRTEVARQLVEEDPARARRLGIGRPDLANSFDAGLIDVNGAPLEVVARVPGVNKRLAKRIVEVREEIDGFSSLDDLGHVLDLDAQTVDRMRDVAVFLPRS